MSPVNPLASTDPTAAAAAASGSSSNSSNSSALDQTGALANENTFLQLLVTQMKNQDPTQPVDSSTFLSQLAEFSQLEQLIGINQGVTQLDTAATAAQTTSTGTTTGSTSGTNGTN